MPAAALFESLEMYPYGCTEQITSRAMPLLYANYIAALAGRKTPGDLKGQIQEAVSTLLNRQGSDGAIGLWRTGDGLASPWLGAYATDFLFRAKAAGFVVPDAALDKAFDALEVASPLPMTVVVPTPAGTPFTQATAYELASRERLVFACGRYEGIDQRVIDHCAERYDVVEVSLGDYVLNGGEVATLAIVEAVVRLLPGVLGNPASLVEESHSDGHQRLLEYPNYTKPPVWRDRAVPAVLLSGHHGLIEEWRREQAGRGTIERRPDLLADDISWAKRHVNGLANRAFGNRTPMPAGLLVWLQWGPWQQHSPFINGRCEARSSRRSSWQ